MVLRFSARAARCFPKIFQFSPLTTNAANFSDQFIQVVAPCPCPALQTVHPGLYLNQTNTLTSGTSVGRT